MPKGGKTDAQWQRRLQQLAAGIRLGQGEYPPRASTWRKKIEDIQNCPRTSGVNVDVLGRTVACICSFHTVIALLVLCLHYLVLILCSAVVA